MKPLTKKESDAVWEEVKQDVMLENNLSEEDFNFAFFKDQVSQFIYFADETDSLEDSVAMLRSAVVNQQRLIKMLLLKQSPSLEITVDLIRAKLMAKQGLTQ